jgi:hypothetical protein
MSGRNLFCLWVVGGELRQKFFYFTGLDFDTVAGFI